jgi:hypothetical protein
MPQGFGRCCPLPQFKEMRTSDDLLKRSPDVASYGEVRDVVPDRLIDPVSLLGKTNNRKREIK